MTSAPTIMNDLRSAARGPGLDFSLIGAGNIGGFVAPMLAGLPIRRAATFFDPGRYAPRHCKGQNIDAADVGRPKAVCQARVARRRLGADVRAVTDRIEHRPLADLRCHVVMTGLDGRGARDYVSRALMRLGGILWIDLGVEPPAHLARVTVLAPSPDSPCYQCGRSVHDEIVAGDVASCIDGDHAGAPGSTNAPAALGSLAASLGVTALARLLAGDASLIGRQAVVCAAQDRILVSRLQRDPCCRGPHERWAITALAASPGDVTLGAALDLGEPAGRDEAQLRVADHAFITRLACPSCHWQRRLLRLQGRLSRAQRACRRCREPMVAMDFHALDALGARQVGRGALGRPMSALGLRPGDVFTVESRENERHYELGGHDRS